MTRVIAAGCIRDLSSLANRRLRRAAAAAQSALDRLFRNTRWFAADAPSIPDRVNSSRLGMVPA